LQNQIALGAFEGAESISALKTTILNVPKLQFQQLWPDSSDGKLEKGQNHRTSSLLLIIGSQYSS
jgi:hypothetical protein